MSSGSNRLSCGAHLNKKHKSKEINRNINSNRIHNSSTNTKTTNISSANNNKDIIILGINQCEDEINNLNIVEKMLMKCLDNDKKKKLFKGKSKSKHYKLSSPEKYNNSQVHFTAYKKSSYNDKKVKKAKEKKNSQPIIIFNYKYDNNYYKVNERSINSKKTIKNSSKMNMKTIKNKSSNNHIINKLNKEQKFPG